MPGFPSVCCVTFHLHNLPIHKPPRQQEHTQISQNHSGHSRLLKERPDTAGRTLFWCSPSCTYMHQEPLPSTGHCYLCTNRPGHAQMLWGHVPDTGLEFIPVFPLTASNHLLRTKGSKQERDRAGSVYTLPVNHRMSHEQVTHCETSQVTLLTMIPAGTDHRKTPKPRDMIYPWLMATRSQRQWGPTSLTAPGFTSLHPSGSKEDLKFL